MQKEENTRRLGRRPEGLESGVRNSGWAKSGQGTMVLHDSYVPASGAQCHPPPIEPIQSPLQVSGLRIILNTHSQQSC